MSDPTALVEALLPCPLCGTEPQSSRDKNVWMVSCPEGPGHAVTALGNTKRQAEARWNLRTHTETVAQDARRKAFEEAAQIAIERSKLPGRDAESYVALLAIADVFRAAALQTGEEE